MITLIGGEMLLFSDLDGLDRLISAESEDRSADETFEIGRAHV